MLKGEAINTDVIFLDSVVREQALYEKEQRIQRQLERSAEERERRLEEQRQREEVRRVAVEEKRRQHEEQEKVRTPSPAPWHTKVLFLGTSAFCFVTEMLE